MTDSSTVAGWALSPEPGADPLSLHRTEDWFRKNGRGIGEICILSLRADANAAPHLHAVIVPDFDWLKKNGHPNSTEFIRFEFQDVAKSLAPGDRPDTFSLRSAPLPRNENGEPDRDRLRSEMSQSAAAAAPATVADPDSALALQLRELICRIRPRPGGETGSNLELDFGLDSLDRVLLLATVEKSFGIRIPRDRAGRIFDLRDLHDAVAEMAPGPMHAAPVSWPEILNSPLDREEQSLADLILKERPLPTFGVLSLAALVRRLVGRCWRFTVEGREHLPKHGRYLLVANHCSHVDPVFLLWGLPYKVARRLSFLGHTEYFGSGWKGAVTKRLKLVPVDPDQYARPGMRLSAEVLRRGFIGMVFPEGERSPNGALFRFHRGLAILAMEMKVPVVPAAITGTYEVLPRRSRRIRCSPVQVRFGLPIWPQPDDSEADLLARIWQAVHALRGPDARARETSPELLSVHGERFL